MFTVIKENAFRLTRLVAIAALCLPAAALHAQGRPASCDSSTTTGGASTITLVNAIERAGTSKANTNSLDGVYYELSNDAGFTQALFATEMISDSAADNDHAPFAVIFVNPTNSAMTITQIDLVSDASKAALFRLSPSPSGITPAVGTWSAVASGSNTVTRNIRWNGLINVPAHSGVDFVVDAKISNASTDIPNVPLTGYAMTSAGQFVTAAYPTDVFVPSGNDKVATGVVAFDNGAYPRGYVPNLTAGVPNTLSVRVQEYANNQSIAGGLRLIVTIPAGWSNVQVVSTPAPWANSVTIVQPTPTSTGQLIGTTNGPVGKGATTAALQFSAVPPVAYADSVYNMQLKLDGVDTSTKQHPVRSVCDGVVHVLPAARAGIDLEFLTPPLSTAAPVRSANLELDFNSINGAGTESYNVDAYNQVTLAWQTLATRTPTSANTQLTLSFPGNSVYTYLDSSNRMRMRFNSPDSSTTRTLRIDFVSWSITRGWQVDGAAGLDTNRGSVDKPLKTIAAAASRAAGGDAIYVNYSGTSDPGNVVISSGKNGTAQCPTLFQGTTFGGNLTKIAGTNPTSDAGFDLEGNFVTVDSFDIDATQVALYSAPGTTGHTYTNNIARVPDGNYGILLYNTASGSVKNNRVLLGKASMIGIWDYAGSSNLIDQNTVQGSLPSQSVGIWTDSSSFVKIQRNVVADTYIGAHIARASGAALLYNNTFASTYINAYSEASTVTSRDNILFGGQFAWRASSGASVSSNYDDVFGSTWLYSNVAAGASSISSDPRFVQTTDPSQSTYFALGSGSPCANAGTDVGNGTNIGAK